MRNFLPILLLAIAPFLGSAQGRNAQERIDHSADSTWVMEHYTKMETYIPMRDGIRLFTSVYLPKDSSGGRHPILMTRTPYSCAPYGTDKYHRFWGSYQMQYLREGYIMVTQDVRGRWMSEGTFEDIRPFNPHKQGPKDIDEASDTYDAIDWLVKNLPGNNGKVGVFGISYPGFYSTMAALSDHPALKAVSPQAPVTDWFQGDDFHHNGAFFVMDGFSFYQSFGKPRPKPTTVGPTGLKDFHGDDNYDLYLRTGSLANFAALLQDSVAFWKDLYAHPDYDAWWRARNDRQYLTHVKPAMLEVGGLFDAEDCFGAQNVYKAIAAQSKGTDNRLVMGPWYHGEWASANGYFLGNVRFGSNTAEYYEKYIEFPFFQHYLNDKGNVDTLARANVFFSGENAWHQFPSWPPAAETPTPLYLQADGKLSFTAPGAQGASATQGNAQGEGAAQNAQSTQKSYSEYVSDPAKPVPYTEDVHFHRTREYMDDDQRFAARRTDVLVFETEPLTSDLTLAGPLVADLQTSISTTDADFVVKLIDVFPDDFSYAPDVKGNGKDYPMGGYQMLVRGDVMRGRFRESFAKPVAFIPGQVTTVKYTMTDVAHTFLKGHRIMVQVQSSWFPLVDRNPQQFVDIYHCKDSDFIQSTIRIYHDSAHPSRIILPVLK
jgi:putative CocE/NonD family hydrolase